MLKLPADKKTPLKLDPDGCVVMLNIGSMLIAVGIMLTIALPTQYSVSWETINHAVERLSYIWWRLVLIVMLALLLWGIATKLVRRMPTLSEYVGLYAIFLLLSPLAVVIVAALVPSALVPSALVPSMSATTSLSPRFFYGWNEMFIFVGAALSWVSLSGLISTVRLRRIGSTQIGQKLKCAQTL